MDEAGEPPLTTETTSAVLLEGTESQEAEPILLHVNNVDDGDDDEGETFNLPESTSSTNVQHSLGIDIAGATEFIPSSPANSYVPSIISSSLLTNTPIDMSSSFPNQSTIHDIHHDILEERSINNFHEYSNENAGRAGSERVLQDISSIPPPITTTRSPQMYPGLSSHANQSLPSPISIRSSLPPLSSIPLQLSTPLSIRSSLPPLSSISAQSPTMFEKRPDSMPTLTIPTLSSLILSSPPSSPTPAYFPSPPYAGPLPHILPPPSLLPLADLPSPIALLPPAIPLSPPIYSRSPKYHSSPKYPSSLKNSSSPTQPSSAILPSSPSSISPIPNPIRSPNSSLKPSIKEYRRFSTLSSSDHSYFSPDLKPKSPNSVKFQTPEVNEITPQPLKLSGDTVINSTIVSTDDNNNEPDIETERKNIIFEILSTEESYVQFLRLVKMIYIWPLRDKIQEKDPILSEAEIADLFANSETLLQQLRRRIRNYTSGIGVGDIFNEVGPYFKMYSTFVRSYFVKGIKLLRELNNKNNRFKTFSQEAKSKCKRLDLSDLLLMPVQRLPRYVLLLESLLRKTPEDHADHKLLSNALVLIKKVADQVNLGTIDDSESLATLLRIQEVLGINAPKDLVQPHRKLVRQANLPLIINDEDLIMPTNVFLFNDLLLLVEDKTSNLLQCILSLFFLKRNILILKGIEVSRIFIRPANMRGTGFKHGVEIFTSGWSRLFGLNSDEDEQQWVDIITKSIEVLTSLHPLHNAYRVQAMKDIHSSRKMSVGERASLFEHFKKSNKRYAQLATVHKNRNNTLPPLAQLPPVASIAAPLSAHVMVEKMKQQQADLMRDNHFLFEKVESNPRLRRSSTMSEIVKRFSAPPKVKLPSRAQTVKCGYLTKQGGLIKNWKRRWFIMGNGYLYYTPDHENLEVLGQIPLKGTVLEVDHDNSVRPYCMIMHTFSRSEKNLDEWMVAVSTYFMTIATLNRMQSHVVVPT